MLTKTSTRVLATLAATFLIFSVAQVANAAKQECYYDGDGKLVCEINDPGNPGDSGNIPGDIPFTVGPKTCESDRVEDKIPCTNGSEDWWNTEKQCYVSVSDPQRPRPAGASQSGAWYDCDATIVPADEAPIFGDTYQFWSDEPPPGISWYSPEQAARQLISTFQLRPASPGIAPPAGVADAWTSVGFQMWMWADDPSALSYGPYTETATLGGVTVTARATTSLIEWDMGNGDTVNCGAGTEPPSNATINDVSPNCGYVYTQTGTFTITPTSFWVVDWNGGGESGQIRFALTGDGRTIEVGELQSVNVPVPGS